MTTREEVERVLAENGVAGHEDNLHSWRCTHYGGCDCVATLIDDLMKLILPEGSHSHVEGRHGILTKTGRGVKDVYSGNPERKHYRRAVTYGPWIEVEETNHD